MREAGATARQLLMQAAADRWEVDLSELRTERGVVLHDKTGRRAGLLYQAEIIGDSLGPFDAMGAAK